MMHPMNTVCILGLGYVGLPTAALMASRGLRVHGVDTEPLVVATVNAGGIHIVEPDLAGLVRSVVEAGRLTAHAAPVAADAFIIAVPTPLTDDRRPMMALVDAATAALAPLLRPGDVVILESTSPVGTTQRLAGILATLRPDLRIPGDVAVAYCPERVLPGRILSELVGNDRCVGGLTPACAERAATLYELFVRGAILRTAAAAAELVKLAENSFRDVNIAFANELSLIAHRHGIDVGGRDRARQSPSAGEHPAARPGRGRPLHRGRSMVHRRCGARRSAPHPHRARGERPQGALGGVASCRTGGRLAAGAHHLLRPRLQGRCR